MFLSVTRLTAHYKRSSPRCPKLQRTLPSLGLHAFSPASETMVFALSRSSISTVWIVLSVLACAISQEIQPSNSTTLPVDPSGPQLIISVPLQIKRPYFTVDPLTNAAGLHNALQQLQVSTLNFLHSIVHRLNPSRQSTSMAL